MANLELQSVGQLVLKTLIVGGLVALGIGVFFGAWIGVSALAGALLVALNLKVVEWVTRQIIRAGEAGQKSGAIWSLLLVLKMLVLFGTIFYLIVRLELDAIGFIVGFSAFLPAIVWQVVISKDDSSSSQD